MSPQEILTIRNQMTKDIKANQISLVISDAQSYDISSEHWPLELSISAGKLDLVKFFLSQNAKISNFTCLEDNVKNAQCVPILTAIMEKQDITPQIMDMLQDSIIHKKIKLTTYILKNFAREDDLQVKDGLRAAFNHFGNKESKTAIPLLCNKLSDASIDQQIDLLDRFDNPEKKSFLLHIKLSKNVSSNKTGVKKMKI